MKLISIRNVHNYGWNIFEWMCINFGWIKHGDRLSPRLEQFKVRKIPPNIPYFPVSKILVDRVASKLWTCQHFVLFLKSLPACTWDSCTRLLVFSARTLWTWEVMVSVWIPLFKPRHWHNPIEVKIAEGHAKNVLEEYTIDRCMYYSQLRVTTQNVPKVVLLSNPSDNYFLP